MSVAREEGRRNLPCLLPVQMLVGGAAAFVIPNSSWEFGMVHSFVLESAELEKAAQVLAHIFSCPLSFSSSKSVSLYTDAGLQQDVGSSKLLLHLLFGISLTHVRTFLKLLPQVENSLSPHEKFRRDAFRVGGSRVFLSSLSLLFFLPYKNLRSKVLRIGGAHVSFAPFSPCS
jgi:hypothetical protein